MIQIGEIKMLQKIEDLLIHCEIKLFNNVQNVIDKQLNLMQDSDLYKIFPEFTIYCFLVVEELFFGISVCFRINLKHKSQPCQFVNDSTHCLSSVLVKGWGFGIPKISKKGGGKNFAMKRVYRISKKDGGK